MGLAYRSPPGRWNLHRGEINLCLVSLAASPGCIEAFERNLAPDERVRARRFYAVKHQEEFIAARGMLRAILGRCLGLPPAGVALEYGDHGKPRIAGGHRLRFNLSHSGGRALYALSLDREIGVDLEKAHPMADLEEIARRFFSPREVSELLSLPAVERQAAFFSCWTRKEAYLKACGDGLALALDGFRVSVLPSEPPRLETPSDPRVWSLSDVSPPDGYAAALVGEGMPATLHPWSFGDADDCAAYFR